MLPIGSVIASILTPSDFAAEIRREAPGEVWVEATGAALPRGSKIIAILNDKADYRSLYSENTPHSPNLTGRFLRGMDATRSVGSLQEDAVGPHFHTVAHSYPNFPNATDRAADNQTLTTKDWHDTFGGAPEVSTQANVGEETRPKNAAVHFYIRVS